MRWRRSAARSACAGRSCSRWSTSRGPRRASSTRLRSSPGSGSPTASRLLDGARAEADESREATAKYRERLAHNVLIWLADRTWLDHWYGEEPKSTPYYKIAGGKYIDDAERLVPGSLAAKQAREQLNQPSELTLVKNKAIVWTSEVDRAIPYQVEEIGKVPPALRSSPQPRETSSTWTGPTKTSGRRPARLRRAAGPGRRVLRHESVPAPPQEAKPTLTKPEVRDTNVDLKGFFRGQAFAGRTEVQIHPLPEIQMLGPDFTNRPGHRRPGRSGRSSISSA